MAHHRSSFARDEPGRADLRRARTVSLISVLWTVATGCSAIAIGLTESSAVLVVFGCVGFVDAAGSVALVYHFHHALRHEAISERLERTAHRIVAVGLMGVGAAAVGLGAFRVTKSHAGTASGAGPVLAAISFAALVLLGHVKRTVASRVDSPALRSDGHLSTIGAVQAAVTLLGVAAASVGWWWADPCAAMFVGAVAAMIGWRTRPGATPT